MNEFYGGRSRVPAAGKVYWQQWVPVARGKGTCGPGIQRALGAAHSIPYPFPSLPPVPPIPTCPEPALLYRHTPSTLGTNSACHDDVVATTTSNGMTLISFLSKPKLWPNVNVYL